MLIIILSLSYRDKHIFFEEGGFQKSRYDSFLRQLRKANSGILFFIVIIYIWENKIVCFSNHASKLWNTMSKINHDTVSILLKILTLSFSIMMSLYSAVCKNQVYGKQLSAFQGLIVKDSQELITVKKNVTIFIHFVLIFWKV